MPRLFSSLALCALFLFQNHGSAADWSEFRGPTGQGLWSGRLPTEWSPTKNVAWKQAIPGLGWSSPIVHEGRIYLTTAVPAPNGAARDQSLQALCLDANSGKIQWSTEVFLQDGKTSPPIQSKNSHASPTPLLVDQRLYVHFGHQGTACLDLQGKVIWRSREVRYAPVHGNGGTPILVDDKLIFSCDGSDKQVVVALDKATGNLVWQTDRRSQADKRFSFSTPLLITVNGRQQVISPASDMVGAYDPKTGEEIWRVRYDGYSVIPRPVYGHGLLFISTSYNSPTLLAIRPDGKGDVTDTHIAWSTKKYAPHTPSLLLVGDELYFVSDNGFASRLGAKTGKVHWQERIGGNYSASPIHADGKIYFQSEQGVGTVVKASTQFEKLAANDMKERTLASCAAVDGALIIRTDKHIYRIQEK
jgi:outer membrane protein assembly factor BamB